MVCSLLYLTLGSYGHTLLQSPVWDDPHVGTHRECGEKILVLPGGVSLCRSRSNGDFTAALAHMRRAKSLNSEREYGTEFFISNAAIELSRPNLRPGENDCLGIYFLKVVSLRRLREAI